MAMVTAKNVDLSNCDAEQVQFSGAVQPHGCLLVIEEPSLTIVQASANVDDLLGLHAERLRGSSLETVLGDRTVDVAARLKREALGTGPVHLSTLSPADIRSKRPLNFFAHRAGDTTILEFEVIPSGADRPLINLYSELRAAIAALQATTTLQSFFDLAVAQIAHLTGYERVMAYKFLEDGSGRVMAEAKAAHLEPYLGLHYPASDIPAPARRMFALSWLRHLPDVDYVPVPIIPDSNPRTGEPLDLSYALLRSVSVMYSGYLKNMGVKSTMVMPLMKNGELWGLLSAMDHAAPRHVPYEQRMAAEFLAHMLSLLMAAKEDAESYGYRLRIKTVLEHLSRKLAHERNLATALGTGEPNLLSYLEADGAAVVTETAMARMGRTPDDDTLRMLTQWLADREDNVTSTDRLGELFTPAGAFAATASGLIAVRLSSRRPEVLMWFRAEQAETVHWAGDPGKPVEVDESDASIRLRPRTSFARWKESVSGRSTPWANFEVEAAADLRRAIVEVILARADEIERVNRELTESNLELDSFAYAASHDLKEPLRGIAHMATFLEEGQGDKLDAEGRKQIDIIRKLSKRMDDLIEALLQYAQTGRADLQLTTFDLETVLDEVLVAIRPRITESGTIIRKVDRLPTVRADKVRIREVLSNLITNALKYNDKPERRVEIGSTPGDSPVIWIKDNGIGIESRYFEHIFQIFRRLHGRDEFGGGTGAGLTIARKTIERHGGRIWLESEPGAGATFYFTLSGTSSRVHDATGQQ